MSSDADAVLKIFDNNSRVLGPAAVGSAVSTLAAASLVVFFIFLALRPRHKVVFQPKVKYHTGTTPPPPISDSLFGWVPPLLRTKEAELLPNVGLDAIAFLRFTKLLRMLFIGVVVVCCGGLIPINIYVNSLRKPKKRDILSMLTIRDVKGVWIYAHVGATYLITLIVMAVVWHHWEVMLKLRYEWFRSPQHLASFQARTLMIQYVPRRYQTDENLRSLLDSLKMPYPVVSVHIARHVGRLPELIKYHNDHVKKLERVLVKYLRGGRASPTRPTISIGGFLGIGSKTVDAIDYYTDRIARAKAAVERHRDQIDAKRAVDYGFASLGSVPYAHAAAQALANKHPKGTVITLAPSPRDIIWKNLTESNSSSFSRKIVGFFCIIVLCTFSLAPLFIVSALANLESLSHVPQFKFLLNWSQKSPATFALAYGLLPPIISAALFFVLPRLMRGLSRYVGATTHAGLDRAVTARFFAFQVISQLVIFTLIGVVINSVQEILIIINEEHGGIHDVLKHLSQLPKTITRAYINQASYWLKWLPLRAFLVFIDLAQIVNFIIISLKKRILGRTPREIREWSKPREFVYADVYVNLLFMAAVGLVFAPLAPLIPAVAMVVFWIASWVYKYQFMFVYVSKVETGGRLWNVVINRLLFSVVLMQALMVLTVKLQYDTKTYEWTCTLPPIAIIAIFKLVIRYKFERHFRFFEPTPEDLKNIQIHSGVNDTRKNRLENRFGHPSLHAELWTPMLFAEMMSLLNQVYNKGGQITNQRTRLRDLGGEKVDTRVMPGGLRIAPVTRENLQYDPALYQRDMSESDPDRCSSTPPIIFGHSPQMPMPSPGGFTPVTPNTPITPVLRDSYFSGGHPSPTHPVHVHFQPRPDSSYSQFAPSLSYHPRPPSNHRQSAPLTFTPPPPGAFTPPLPPGTFNPNYPYFQQNGSRHSSFIQ